MQIYSIIIKLPVIEFNKKNRNKKVNYRQHLPKSTWLLGKKLAVIFRQEENKSLYLSDKTLATISAYIIINPS